MANNQFSMGNFNRFFITAACQFFKEHSFLRRVIPVLSAVWVPNLGEIPPVTPDFSAVVLVNDQRRLIPKDGCLL
jgi:hypothetical protein